MHLIMPACIQVVTTGMLILTTRWASLGMVCSLSRGMQLFINCGLQAARRASSYAHGHVHISLNHISIADCWKDLVV